VFVRRVAVSHELSNGLSGHARAQLSSFVNELHRLVVRVLQPETDVKVFVFRESVEHVEGLFEFVVDDDNCDGTVERLEECAECDGVDPAAGEKNVLCQVVGALERFFVVCPSNFVVRDQIFFADTHGRDVSDKLGGEVVWRLRFQSEIQVVVPVGS